MSYCADKQVIDTHTHGQTQKQAMTIHEGQNWPRVETVMHMPIFSYTIQDITDTNAPLPYDCTAYYTNNTVLD